MNRMLSFTLSSAIACVLAMVFSSCGKQEDKAAQTRTTIAVIPKGTTHEFWKSIHAGAVKAARELNVEIIWKGPLREDDREAQISVMEDFISRGVQGIVLAPLDDIALRGPVTNATRAGIPVVIIDSDLKSDDYVSFAATDNYLGGKMGAEELIRLLDGKGRVIMFRCLEGSASTVNRERGFLDAMAAAPGITVVSANQYGGADGRNGLSCQREPACPAQGRHGEADHRRHFHAERIDNLRHAPRAAGWRRRRQSVLCRV